jgi:hypothetical protein
MNPTLRAPLRSLLGVALFFSLAGVASAQLIDFETTPSGAVPLDDQVLGWANPYLFPGGQVQFGFDTDLDTVIDADALFELIGTTVTEGMNAGFQGSDGIDTADAGFTAQLGDWFLRSSLPGSDFGHFVIQYTSSFPVTAASGEVWDIDGTPGQGGSPSYTEEYTVRAYDALGNLLDTQVSPLGTLNSASAPLDGRPWTFAFSGLTAGIDRIVVDFTGSKPSGIGLAFNNFSPLSAVPEPTAAALAIVSLLGAGVRRNPR